MHVYCIYPGWSLASSQFRISIWIHTPPKKVSFFAPLMLEAAESARASSLLTGELCRCKQLFSHLLGRMLRATHDTACNFEVSAEEPYRLSPPIDRSPPRLVDADDPTSVIPRLELLLILHKAAHSPRSRRKVFDHRSAAERLKRRTWAKRRADALRGGWLSLIHI